MKGSGEGKVDLLLELVEKSASGGLFGGLELDDVGERRLLREKLAELGSIDGFVEIDITKSICTVRE